MLRTYVGRTKIFDYSAALNATITAEQATAWAAGSVITWADEELGVAKMPAEGEPRRLDAAYVASKRPAIEQQLRRGGVRLAVVLNRSFGTTRD